MGLNSLKLPAAKILSKPGGFVQERDTPVCIKSRSGVTSRPRILLSATLRWPTAARLAIAFAGLGCHVEVICPREHPAGKTHAVSKIHLYAALSPLKSLYAAIRLAAPDFIIPCDDTAAVNLHQLYTSVGARSPAANLVHQIIALSLGMPEACTFATARGQLIALAAEEGVRVPDTTVITALAGFESWLTQFGFPAVIKADHTWGGLGVVIVRNMQEAQSAYQYLTVRPSIGKTIAHIFLERDLPLFINSVKRMQRIITVQRYITGTPANRAVACWQGQVLAGISVEAIHTQHLTGPASVVRVIEHREMTEATARLVRRLGVSGLWGMDFILEASTGSAYLIEMNPRATPISHLVLGPGRNLPAAIYAQLIGEPVRSPPVTITQDTIALFPGEYQRDPRSAWLHFGYHDIPVDEPELVDVCLDLPWSERGLIARIWAHFRKQPVTQPARLKTSQDIPECTCVANDRFVQKDTGRGATEELAKKK